MDWTRLNRLPGLIALSVFDGLVKIGAIYMTCIYTQTCAHLRSYRAA